MSRLQTATQEMQLCQPIYKKKVYENTTTNIKLSNRRGKPSTFQKVFPSNSQATTSNISTQQLFKLKADNNLSLRKTLNVVKSIRGCGINVEPDTKMRLQQLNKQLEQFFGLAEPGLSFEHCDGQTVHIDTPIVYCKDIPGLVQRVTEARSLDMQNMLVKLGIDGGGGFFKVTLSIISMNSDHPQHVGTFKDSGVRRIIILALASTNLEDTSST